MSIYQILQSTGLPCAYSHFKTKQEPPYIVYIGTGQNNMSADNTYYYGVNSYQIEYYYTQKNEANETAIESALLASGYQYTKSEDTYDSDQDVFVIYYDV